MNSVHEPGPNGDSETLLSRKTRSKTTPVAQAPNWPSWPSLRAQVAPGPRTRGRVVGGLDVLWSSPPVVSQRSAPTPRSAAPRLPSARSACLGPHACRPARPSAHACAYCAPSAPQRLLPARLLAVSWLGWALYHNTVQPCLCSTVAIHLSVLRYSSSPCLFTIQ